MDADPSAPPCPAVAREGHVDQSPAGGEEPPQLRGTAMAEMSTATTLCGGEYRRHPATILRKAGVPDRVDALVHPMQPAEPDAPADLLSTQAGFE